MIKLNPVKTGIGIAGAGAVAAGVFLAVLNNPAGTDTPTTPTTTTDILPTARIQTVPEPTESLPGVPRLVIAQVPTDLPVYNRKDWRHWVDEDRDCQNTRAEVLIAESTKPVTFTREQECTVANGSWEGPYTGKRFASARQLDVDHMVPLANAHRSGGWQWSPDRKREYANYLAYPNHLIAVDRSANRSKGSKGPEEWLPTDGTYICSYVFDWVLIKDRWGLTATTAEWARIETILEAC